MNGLIVPFCIYCKALYNCVLKDFHYCWHYSTHNLVTTSFWLFTQFGNLMSLDFDSDVKKMQVFRLIKRGWHETFCILLQTVLIAPMRALWLNVTMITQMWPEYCFISDKTRIIYKVCVLISLTFLKLATQGCFN